MALRINFNYESAVTHTALKTNERLMNKSLLRLSTGLRILNAADDSAGLFIADQLALVSAGLEQGNRNIQTGISALQIAENSAGQIYNKLKEIYVKAENAANDINDPNARAALQREIDNLISAIEKIGRDTEYNGIKLLDGTFTGKYIHYGARKDQVVSISIDSVLPKDLGAYLARAQGAIYSSAGAGTNASFSADLGTPSDWVVENGDYVDIAGIRVISWDGTDRLVDAKTLADAINSNTDLQALGIEAQAKNVNQASESFTGFANLWTDANDTLNSLRLDFFVGAADATATTGDFVVVIDSDVTSLQQLVDKINTAASAAGKDIRAKAVDGKLVLETGGGETIGVKITASTTTGTGGDGVVTVRLGQLFEGLGNVNFDNNQTYFYIDVGEVDIAGIDTYKVNYSGVSNTNVGFNFNLAPGGDATAKNLNAINVLTNPRAEEALLIIKKAIQRVDIVRSEIGAVMNNLQTIYDAQKVAQDNTNEAESVIRNVDFAKEMATFTTMQIRMQSGIAMLAQANTLPQLVLQLLR
ncbi:MAG: flagellin [Aquificae bacterium]|nr:flagellin [Aquificota bacterium]